MARKAQNMNKAWKTYVNPAPTNVITPRPLTKMEKKAVKANQIVQKSGH